MNIEQTLKIAFQIISYAGDANHLFLQSIDDAKNSRYEDAEKKMNEANEFLKKAHKEQTSLITKEAQGEQGAYSIIMVHAQDHLMNGILMQKLTQEFCELYKRVNEKVG